MARIKFGMIVVDARGKLGGHVFSKTRSGATTRTKVTPSNPQTTAQALARVIFGSISQKWRNLSQTQRDSWDSQAETVSKTNAFGDVYFPSGKNYFQSVNSNLLNVGKPLVDSPVTPIPPPAVIATDVTIINTDATIDIEYSETAPVGTYSIVYEATPPLSAGKKNFSGKFAKITNVAGGTFPTGEALYDAYTDKYGVPPVGSRVAVRVKTISSTGHASTYSTVETLVAS